MFYIFIAFFSIASGFTSADQLCSRRRVCSVRRENEPREFPTTAEDLKKVCDFAIKMLDCEIELEERCHRMPERLPAAYDMYGVVQEVCNPESLLHAAVVDNLACFYDSVSNEGRSCIQEDLSEETLEMQVRELVKEGFNKEDENSDTCLRDLNVFACEAIVLEQKCGKIAMDAVVEIIQRSMAFVHFRCNKKIVKMLPNVIRLRRLENEIEEALKRRRK